MGRRPRSREELEKVFWSRVDKCEPDECWIWTAGRSPRGYGKIRFEGNHWRAHRLAFYLTRGVPPGDYRVCHTCDNPPCCNPSHLWLGTDADNVADKLRKGREKGPALKGRANLNASLSPEKVIKIRQMYENGEASQAELSRLFDVTQGAISKIVLRKTWRHV